jgi:NitT/TauT family transport system substrate-binding protein
LRRVLIAILCVSALRGVAAHGTEDYGKPGEPIHLAVGYQPYFAASWSGAVLRTQRYFERYLPHGSSVDFQIGIKGGGVITAALLSGRESIGYLGSTSTLAVATRPANDGTRIRIIATTSLGHDLCDILLVRHDAPVFSTPQDALKWMGQRTFAVPYHTCAHAFALQLLAVSAQPRVVIDATPDLISRAFSTGHLDAAVVWEPFASQLVESGHARQVAVGASSGAMSAAFIVVRDDLLSQRPDVVQAWLRAEFDAQRFLSDPRNHAAVVQTIRDQTSGLSAAAIDRALYQANPAVQDTARERAMLPFDVTPAAIDVLNQTASALSRSEGGPAPKPLPADAINGDIAREILRERGPPYTYATTQSGGPR